MILFKLSKVFLVVVTALISTGYAATNQKPIANAGEDQNVTFSSNVTLSGMKSFDTDGEIKTYQWTQIKGTKVILKNPKTVSATFTSPKKNELLIFKLTVKDDKNASATDTINVNVNTQIVQSATSPLNDTGITFCSDGAFNVQSCNISSYPRQDAEFGRDIEKNDNQDGHAGFSFSKIGENGENLPLDAKNWACIKDNVSGLIWENKTVSNAEFLYTFNSAENFINEKNQKKWCGLSNWRLPQIQELQNIVDYSFPFPDPAIDLAFFSNSTNKIYWSATTYAKNNQDAWGIYFDDGRVFEQSKNLQAAVRLVSGLERETNLQKYQILENGHEVLDTQTGLIWRRCIEGMRWNGNSCEGHAFGGMFVESLERAAMQAKLTDKNWRLPNIKELASLIDFSEKNLAVDTSIFSNTPNDQFWSSSPYAMDAFYGWVTHFYYGSSYYTYLEDTGMIRLVRNAK